jgi:hypothetical protein
MAKPSTLWPVEPVKESASGRVAPTESDPPPAPGHADTLKPSDHRISQRVAEIFACSTNAAEGDYERRLVRSHVDDVKLDHTTNPKHTANQEQLVHKNELEGIEQVMSDQPGSTLQDQKNKEPTRRDVLEARRSYVMDHKSGSSGSQADTKSEEMLRKELKEDWEPKPPKVLMDDPLATPLELRAQIQIYATNESALLFISWDMNADGSLKAAQPSSCVAPPSGFARKSSPPLYYCRRWRGVKR